MHWIKNLIILLYSIIILYFEHTSTSEINIAYNKAAYQSSFELEWSATPQWYTHAFLAVDGNNNTNYENGRSCSRNKADDKDRWLVVDLGSQFQIQRVVLTNRRDFADRLDRFLVGVTNYFSTSSNPPVRGKYPLCGQYPGPAAPGGRLEVICDVNILPGRYVIIQQPEDGKGSMTICELEVYASYNEQWIGCYESIGSDNAPGSLQHDARMTAEKCITRCRQYNTTFAAIHKGECCTCGENYRNSLPERYCHMTSSNQSKQPKKSSTTVDVYSVCPIGFYGAICEHICNCLEQKPCKRLTGSCPNGCENDWSGSACNKLTAIPTFEFLGCFGDKSHDRDLNYSIWIEAPDLGSPEQCISSCRTNGFAYAGIQNSHECFCGNDYGKRNVSKNCLNPCSGGGNTTLTCGGNNANSVYSTFVCPNGTYGHNCSRKCHCSNNSACLFFNGTCTNNCSSGWTGSSCNKIDCDSNYTCGLNETCQGINLISANLTRCECKDDYYRQDPWDQCIALAMKKDGSSQQSKPTENPKTVPAVAGFPSDPFPTTNIMITDTLGFKIGVGVGSGACFIIILVIIITKRRRQRRRARNKYPLQTSNGFNNLAVNAEFPDNPIKKSGKADEAIKFTVTEDGSKKIPEKDDGKNKSSEINGQERKFSGAGNESRTFSGEGNENRKFSGAGIENRKFSGAGIENRKFSRAGIENRKFSGAGIENRTFSGIGDEKNEMPEIVSDQQKLSEIGNMDEIGKPEMCSFTVDESDSNPNQNNFDSDIFPMYAVVQRKRNEISPENENVDRKNELNEL